ncbi:MAG TPA: hypothetical protein VNL15_03780 [Dehalococcoidia bacterium]|nr:hypothetical protein [Dehalococcoidia bacterium]
MWIEHVEEKDASGLLAEVYEKAKAEFGGATVPITVKALSLRPEAAAAKEALRRSIHGNETSLGPRWTEMINAVVSGYNDCRY